jgi:hypothetical protein
METLRSSATETEVITNGPPTKELGDVASGAPNPAIHVSLLDALKNAVQGPLQGYHPRGKSIIGMSVGTKSSHTTTKNDHGLIVPTVKQSSITCIPAKPESRQEEQSRNKMLSPITTEAVTQSIDGKQELDSVSGLKSSEDLPFESTKSSQPNPGLDTNQTKESLTVNLAPLPLLHINMPAVRFSDSPSARNGDIDLGAAEIPQSVLPLGHRVSLSTIRCEGGRVTPSQTPSDIKYNSSTIAEPNISLHLSTKEAATLEEPNTIPRPISSPNHISMRPIARELSSISISKQSRFQALNSGSTRETALEIGLHTNDHSAQHQTKFNSPVESIRMQSSTPANNGALQGLRTTSSDVNPSLKPIEFVPISGPALQKEGNSLWRRVAAFITFDENVYWARDLQAQAHLIREWNEIWYPQFHDRLLYLGLGPDILGMQLIMAGPAEDITSMRPTILVLCPKGRRRTFETTLATFIPDGLKLKVVGRDVVLCSASVGLPSKPGERTGCLVEAKYDAENLSAVGRVTRVLSGPAGGSCFPESTIGGIISVGDLLFAITTAHSMFKKAVAVPNDTVAVGDIEDSSNLNRENFRACGYVETYEWSGTSASPIAKLLSSNRQGLGMDWVLIRIVEDFCYPNRFKRTLNEVELGQNGATRDNRALNGDGHAQESNYVAIAGFLKMEELTNREVWVCAGVSGTQVGILSTTCASIVHGQTTFEVRSLALERPLGM